MTWPGEAETSELDVNSGWTEPTKIPNGAVMTEQGWERVSSRQMILKVSLSYRISAGWFP